MLGERAIGVDRPTQDEAHLIGDKSAQPVRPLLWCKLVQLGEDGGASCLVTGPGRTKILSDGASRRQSREPGSTGQRQIGRVAAVVAQQCAERMRTLLGG